jgi:phosphoribosylamine--glycine ligase
VKILVVGGGGREHALCWALSRSATVFCAPGNPGTSACATNLPVSPDDQPGILDAIKHHGIDLTVVGPEGPLAAGLADFLQGHGRHVFGPTAAAAQIEASKAYAKETMIRAGVPTARVETFRELDAAEAYIAAHPEPLVVKASGLAAGKGAVVCSTRAEAREAAQQMFAGRFGTAGNIVLVEEFLEGEELSVFAVTDGEHTMVLPSSQDHKRLQEKDLGPNTGGMGAYCPVSMASDDLLDRIEDEVIGPTLRAMAEHGAPYRGFLYAGLMISPDGDPSVIEFNCRMGDPEAQVVLPSIAIDLLPHFWSICEGTWRPPPDRVPAVRTAVTTVLAAPGYPDAPRKGAPISIPASPLPDTILFHAGTKTEGDTLLVSGGRVLCATGIGYDIAAAGDASRRLADAIQFDGKLHRRDIGWREVARAGIA